MVIGQMNGRILAMGCPHVSQTEADATVARLWAQIGDMARKVLIEPESRPI